ncbi:helix-turn-helix domain-containing protein [Muricoccus radiodurans]|uniref:helix-turn-helix domain-containing protein n=1 Tax=Muricoccus radiodurans TaxID=2231721 RepID=UPI003CF090AD
MTAAQCRAARQLLGWSVNQLAQSVPCVWHTVYDFERGQVHPKPATARRLRTALETAGVEFLAESGEGPRVRLTKAGAARDP